MAVVSVIIGLIFVASVQKRRRRWVLGVGGPMRLMLFPPPETHGRRW